jgi:hypothetical protein
VDDFEQEVCRRLPLAEASLRLLDYVLRDDFLDQVYERHRGACYEKIITFPLLVQLIADALLQPESSGHQSFTRAKEDGILKASTVAAYGKLSRIPLSLSRGLLAEATPRLIELLPSPATRSALPPSLQGFVALALDGKKIKYVAKRLKALRKVQGHVLGGKLVVAQELSSGLALGFNADLDGEAGDAALVPAVLDQVRAERPGPRLWIADGGFCDLIQPRQFARDGDHYVLRYNAKVSFTADPCRPAQSGQDAQGRAFTEEWGWLGKGERRIEVRRITLRRPGDKPVIVVTDLLDARQYPAVDILAVYLLRWGIEHLFQDITEVFQLRPLIGGTPQATVFQAAFSFLLYNVIVVMKSYLATATRPVEVISSEKLFVDVERELVAWQVVIGPEQTAEVLGEALSVKQLKQRLRQLLGSAWTERWRKAPKKKHPTKHPKKEYLKGGHNSVYRLLQKAKLAKQPAAKKAARGPTGKPSTRRKRAAAGGKRC